MATEKVRVWPIFLADGSLIAINAPPLKNHLRVSAVYDLLQERLAVLGVDPIALELITESDEGVFFENLQPWYDLTLKSLGVRIKSEDFDWRSRYSFFLAGPRVEWKGHAIADLPGISRLLGYARSETPGAEPKHTTGDPCLDAWVAVTLCFKQQWRAYLDLPLSDAVAATAMAGAIYAEQQEEMDRKYGGSESKKGGLKPQLRQPTLESDPVESIPSELVKELSSEGLILPDGI